MWVHQMYSAVNINMHFPVTYHISLCMLTPLAEVDCIFSLRHLSCALGTNRQEHFHQATKFVPARNEAAPC